MVTAVTTDDGTDITTTTHSVTTGATGKPQEAGRPWEHVPAGMSVAVDSAAAVMPAAADIDSRYARFPGFGCSKRIIATSIVSTDL
jgi:hypothetical protein